MKKNESEKDESDHLSSPCVRNCCLDQDDICLGCYRHLDEIIAWHSSTNEQKLMIKINCDQRRLSQHRK